MTATPDPQVASVEPVTWWRATVTRPWGIVDRDVLLWRHVSSSPLGEAPAEWFRDDVRHTDIPREHLADLRRALDHPGTAPPAGEDTDPRT